MGVVACQATDSRDEAPKTAKAIVYGKVISPNNSGFSDVLVTTYNSIDGCKDIFESDTRAHDRTNKAGKYYIIFHIAGPDKDSCSIARIKLPSSSNFITPNPQKFNVDFRDSPPYDSIGVDFVLKESHRK